MIMIYKKATYIIQLLVLLAGVTTFAQQDPQYTQYMYNMSVLNPGYATDDAETISLGLLYRAQWIGSVGGPTTASFFGHTAITNRVEGGISIVHDEIGGVVKETKAFADIAYVLPVGETHRLSLGIKAGAAFFSTNFNGFVYSDPLPDPAFASNISKTFPNIGAGAFYFGNQFYLGFSAPNLLRTKHLEKDSGVVMNGVEEIHMFMTGGYVFQMNDKIKLKPAFMSKMVSGAPLSLDLTLNALFSDNFELGVGYRYDDSISALVNMRVAPPIRIGYSYDYTLSNLGEFNSGSHEIMILFDISTTEKGYDKSPRFF